MAALSDEFSVRLFDDEEDFGDGFHYLCGRLLSGKQVALSSLSAALSKVWGLSERVLIRQEVESVVIPTQLHLGLLLVTWAVVCVC